MNLTEAVAKRVKEILKEKGMTQYALFKKTGVPQSTISTLLTGNVQTIKLCTIHEICKPTVFGIYAFIFIKLVGIEINFF